MTVLQWQLDTESYTGPEQVFTAKHHIFLYLPEDLNAITQGIGMLVA